MREKIRESENRVADLKAAVDADFSLDLKAASTAGVQGVTDNSATPIDWDALITDFGNYKTVRTQEIKQRTWERAYPPVMEILKDAIAERPVPRNCKALLTRMVDNNPTMKAGTSSRKTLVGNACQLLACWVAHKGLAQGWLTNKKRSLPLLTGCLMHDYLSQYDEIIHS